jgi:hypothetical protein
VSTNKLPTNEVLAQLAMDEHDYLVKKLIEHRVKVSVFDNTIPQAPDALFCNNWISVHYHDNIKHIVIYPMALENRRTEVRPDIIKTLMNHPFFTKTLSQSMKSICLNKDESKFVVHDLRMYSNDGPLEGTGSMVLDRENKIAYAALSDRTHYATLKHFAKLMSYKIVTFNTLYERTPVYHTNVVMSIGENWVVVCSDVIDPLQRQYVMDHLKASKRDVIDISAYQMTKFCANILEVVNENGIKFTVMSQTALDAFSTDQLYRLGNIISVPFKFIETYGGGGVRCCLAEI